MFLQNQGNNALEIFAKFPNFQGSFPLFATLPPFRNTFSESLGVAKRGTTGVFRPQGVVEV